MRCVVCVVHVVLQALVAGEHPAVDPAPVPPSRIDSDAEFELALAAHPIPASQIEAKEVSTRMRALRLTLRMLQRTVLNSSFCVFLLLLAGPAAA